MALEKWEMVWFVRDGRHVMGKDCARDIWHSKDDEGLCEGDTQDLDVGNGKYKKLENSATSGKRN